MTSRPAALMLAPETPYPTIGGGALRTASLLEYLSRRYETDVIVFRQPQFPDPAASFPPGMTRSVQSIDLPFHSRSLPARLIRNAGRAWRGVAPLNDRFFGFSQQVADAVRDRQYQVAIIEHFWCAPYVEQLAAAGPRVLLDLHNIESVLHDGYARSEPWSSSFAFRRFRDACLALERQLLPKFSTLLTASDDDAGRVRTICPGAKVSVYPNTLPLVPQPRLTIEDVLLFTGNLEYPPNRSAVRFFRDRVWPILRNRWPGLIWKVAGLNPGAVRGCLAGDPRIRLIGPMEDAIQCLAAAKVALAPLLSGSGTRFKILEAWAAACPVVSTRLGAEGLGACHGKHLLLADSPEAFAAAVSSLLESGELRSRISQAGRAFYESNFTWEAGWKRLEALGI